MADEPDQSQPRARLWPQPGRTLGALMVRFDYVKGSYSSKSSQDSSFNSSRASDIMINGPVPSKLKTNSRLFDARLLKTRTLKLSSLLDYRTLKARFHNSQRHSNSLFNTSTLRKRTLDFHTVDARSFDSQILSNSIPPFKVRAFTKKRSYSNSLIPSSRNLNSHTFKVRMFTSSKLSNRTFKSPTFRTRILNSPRFNAPTAVHFHKSSNHTLNIPTLRTRTLNSPKLNTLYSTLNPHTVRQPTPNAAQPTAQTLNDIIFDDQYLNEWFEDTIVKPIEDIKDSRRSDIDGLKNFKKRVNEINEKKKKLSDFNENEIIPNDKYELENILAHSQNVPNFKESFVDKAAERFDKIQSEYLKHKVKEQEISGRRMAQENVITLSPAEYEQLYPTTTTVKPDAMDRILALMNQFIFQSQTRLINGQLLRSKYVSNIKYKIGYVLALLRILKQQQMRLYSSMHFNRLFPPIVEGLYYTPVADYMYYLILYEKIIRLDDDIVTTVRYLWKLNVERKEAAIIAATKFPKRIKLTVYRGFDN